MHTDNAGETDNKIHTFGMQEKNRPHPATVLGMADGKICNLLACYRKSCAHTILDAHPIRLVSLDKIFRVASNGIFSC